MLVGQSACGAILRQSTHLRTIGPLSRQNMQPALDISPPLHRGMENNLDRSAFHKSIPVLAVRIAAQKTGVLLKSDAMRRCARYLPDPLTPGIEISEATSWTCQKFGASYGIHLQVTTIDWYYSKSQKKVGHGVFHTYHE